MPLGILDSSSAYFPQAKAYPAFLSGETSLDERPREVGPILDPDHSQEPITAYDEIIHETLYPPPDPSNDNTSSRPIPPKPDDFSDLYLFPVLSKNERLRLTMLWYYTRDITKDPAFLAKLNGLVNMIQQFMGWEFAIMGLLDEAIYTRLATANLPIALLPRRESTCSHTINQPTGDVYMLMNMLEDWRFSESPHVRLGGLRSYAGVPLRLKSAAGEHVALGSLCIASNSVREPLTPDQQANLVRFADILTAEIVTRRQTIREQERASYQESVSKLQLRVGSVGCIRDSVLEVIQQAYPHTIAMYQSCSDGLIRLEHRSAIHLSDVRHELWEDVDYIENSIRNKNFSPLESVQTVRAIVARCGSSGEALVVLSQDMHLVFDDVDAWFVSACAAIVAESIQEEALQEALKAKTRFLRGITHQLRTPIHGVLVSAELLAEELATQQANAGLPIGPSCYLDSIKSSGRELMTTVNNILKLNNWTDSATTLKAKAYDLAELEDDVITDVLQVIEEEQLGEVAITFHNKLPVDQNTILVDASLLKECIESLVLNALQATTYGAVEVTISIVASALQFDIIDTGCGIKPEDHERIFESYEKGDVHTKGAGLGLTIAAKIATVMHGSVQLVSSAEGSGSHFRVQFHNPEYISITKMRPEKHGLELRYSPRTYCLFAKEHVVSSLPQRMCAFLDQHGFHQCKDPNGSLLILSHLTEEDDIPSSVKDLKTSHVIICVGVPVEKQGPIKASLDHHRVLFITGPLYQSRLEEILKIVESRYEEIAATAITTAHPTSENPGSTSLATTSFSRASSVSITTSRVIQTALLVDDNAINLRILRMYCEKRNLPYVMATDGNEAVQKYQLGADTGSISLTMLDLQMPNCDGAEACAQIRAWEAARGMQRTVIFIVTGQDNVIDRTRSFEAGADEFFVKPVSLKLLDRGINKYFPGHCPAPS
ncbi:histidine kinase HHK3 [Dendryphion nanum]|uniref:histidine kinase n=1 Tax=Dendryphion nanum TaxID=256645 RepID=A0A9P9DIN3_9PLEO|nr:histidine kinase HHK3 [Dendryphion nanum]